MIIMIIIIIIIIIIINVDWRQLANDGESWSEGEGPGAKMLDNSSHSFLRRRGNSLVLQRGSLEKSCEKI